MSIILEGKTISTHIQQQLRTQVNILRKQKSVYLAIIFIGHNHTSAAYVQHKKKFGDSIGIDVEIFGQNEETSYSYLQKQKAKILKHRSATDIIDLIHFLNDDTNCVGIIVQLPLPHPLKEHTLDIVRHICWHKDVDDLSGRIHGLASFGMIDFLGATPQAVATLLEAYHLDCVQGKIVSILGQSNLVGKPLVSYFIRKGATVLSFNSASNPDAMRALCKKSNYIISCTGIVHLIDDSFIDPLSEQIVVDVGYGYHNGIPVGDVQLDVIKDKVFAYTPVPGGVGPLTVASIFQNICKLYNMYMSGGVNI